tara:strand:- start:2964 stop:3164 length:201 start_codon:yes stop_codon:yes gene_type:complete
MLMTGLGYVNLYYDSSLESFKCKDFKLNNCKNKTNASLLSIIYNVTKYKSNNYKSNDNKTDKHKTE